MGHALASLFRALRADVELPALINANPYLAVPLCLSFSLAVYTVGAALFLAILTHRCLGLGLGLAGLGLANPNPNPNPHLHPNPHPTPTPTPNKGLAALARCCTDGATSGRGPLLLFNPNPNP